MPIFYQYVEYYLISIVYIITWMSFKKYISPLISFCKSLRDVSISFWMEPVNRLSDEFSLSLLSKSLLSIVSSMSSLSFSYRVIPLDSKFLCVSPAISALLIKSSLSLNNEVVPSKLLSRGVGNLDISVVSNMIFWHRILYFFWYIFSLGLDLVYHLMLLIILHIMTTRSNRILKRHQKLITFAFFSQTNYALCICANF